MQKIVSVHDKQFEIFLSEAEIQAKVKELARQINQDYEAKDTIILPVLNGSAIFAADLFRCLEMSPELHFIRVASYANMESSGAVRPIFGMDFDMKGKHILLVEDIVDSGLTLDYLCEEILKQEPASLKMVALLFKPEALRGKTQPDYVGFSIPPAFVIGYGLDYNQKGRELRDIYQLKVL